MPKQLQLSIPKPCHEDWDKMTQAEKGRFCGACQKQVMDFTNMSDSQLVAFFKKEATGSVCGRFMPEQLDKAMDIPKKRIPWVKYFFQFTLPLFLASLKSTAQTTKGKVSVRQVEAKTDTACKKPGMLIPRVGTTTMCISGRKPVRQEKEITGSVIGADNKPVPYANVMIKGTATRVEADSSGFFRIAIPAKQDSAILSVSSVGYENTDVILTEESRRTGVMIIQLALKSVSEVVVVTSYSAIKGMIIVGQVSSIRKTPMKTESPDLSLTTTATTIYPNPVPAGEAINIKCDKMEEDYYSFQLITTGGQQVFQKEIWIDNEATIFNLPLPRVTPGIYIIVMTGRQGRGKFTEKIIIQ